MRRSVLDLSKELILKVPHFSVTRCAAHSTEILQFHKNHPDQNLKAAPARGHPKINSFLLVLAHSTFSTFDQIHYYIFS